MPGSAAMGRGLLEDRIGRLPAPLAAARAEEAEEAAPPPRVAGDPARGLHAQEHGVAVAVEPHLHHLLGMARGLALAPERAPRARPVRGLARGDRPLQRLARHPRHHEDLAARGVLRHDRHEAVPVPRHFVDPARVAHSRISMPRPARKRFAWPTVISPKWKTEAASTASAPPRSMPSARCSRLPTPPLAMTGTVTAPATARVSARSKPLFVPSRSMLVRRISPAPRAAIVAAHSTASSPRAFRPPWVYTSH